MPVEYSYGTISLINEYVILLEAEQAGVDPPVFTPASYVPSLPQQPAGVIATGFVCVLGCDLGFPDAQALANHQAEEHQAPANDRPVHFIPRSERVLFLSRVVATKVFIRKAIPVEIRALVYMVGMDGGVLTTAGMNELLLSLQAADPLLPGAYFYLNENTPLPAVLRNHYNVFLGNWQNVPGIGQHFPLYPARALQPIAHAPSRAYIAEHEVRFLEWNGTPTLFRGKFPKSRTSSPLLAGIEAQRDGTVAANPCGRCAGGNAIRVFEVCHRQQGTNKCGSCLAVGGKTKTECHCT
ncbi:hypothetical protein BJ508DRAFT_307523 [Ascobolus immersus RN42]|uniref:C2H2-type domain-containing protein n=1 Tax=Ascobolus immersus RN42 TaxID=1160509 RepID=A0A3N4I811_ASCIM|nr:hypothetical protein BJ508DRAFT_307523 [Ascobolus immersus RN42]